MNAIKKLIFIQAGIIILCFSAAVFAEKPVRGFYFEQTAAASYNPLGLELTSDIFYRQPLNMGSGELWDSAKIDFGLENGFTPADDRVSVYVNIEPIAIFDIGLNAGYAGMYDAFKNGFTPRASFRDSFDGNDLKDAHRENKKAVWAKVAPRLKFQIGQIIAAHKLTLDYIRVNDNQSGYYYEPHNDAILKNKDYTVKNDSYLLYKINDLFMIGGNHSLLFVPSSEYKIQTVAAVEIFTYSFGTASELNLALQEGTHLKNRYFRHKLYLAGEAGVTVKL